MDSIVVAEVAMRKSRGAEAGDNNEGKQNKAKQNQGKASHPGETMVIVELRVHRFSSVSLARNVISQCEYEFIQDLLMESGNRVDAGP